MLTRTPPDSIGAPQAARLGDQLLLAVWQDEEGHAASFRPQLGADPLQRPYAAVRLDGTGRLQAALMRLPRRIPAGGLLRLGADRRHAPALALDRPMQAVAAVAAALPEGARSRLLAFLLETGSGLFRAGRQAELLRACHMLADMLADGQDLALRSARVVALLPDGSQMVSVPSAQATGTWHHLSADSIRRVPSVAADEVIYVICDRAATGDTLHAGGGALPWRIVAAAQSPPHLLGWLETVPPSLAESLTALLHAWDRSGRSDHPARAALLRELALLRPRQALRHDGGQHPVAAALELALPDGENGIFLRGWLRDPHGLVRSMRLSAPWGEVPLPQGALHRFARPELAGRFARAAHVADPPEGFVVHLADFGGSALQPELILALESGAQIRLVPPLRSLPPAAARDAVLGSVPPHAASEAAIDACLAPAAARLHRAALAGPRAADILRIGTPPQRPRFSVLVPLYRTLSFLRTQVACFACDPSWAGVETIFVLDSPEQQQEVEHLLRGLHLMHGLAFTLVVMTRNLGYAAANNAGAAAARAPALLLLNSDVVPDRPGWLDALAAPLADRRIGATGAKLLFEDASIQHAGLYFERDPDGLWFNRHYFKGFPRGFAPAGRARAVPALTGAALLVRRSLFEQLGGISEDYIIGDYEDSDFCLKLRGTGSAVAYAPGAELWHFERRSISAHRGYTRTLASLYNRRLHHARWDATIAALMALFGRAGAA